MNAAPPRARPAFIALALVRLALLALLAPAQVQAAASASFVRSDATTRGSWKGVYGSDGYNVINDTQSYPAYATVTPSGQLSYTWAASTTDPRGLQKAASTTDRIASTWYTSSSYTYGVVVNDGQTHALALYALDWDNYNGRTETIEIRDSATNVLLDSRDLAGFVSGTWLVWNISGSVTVVVRNTNAGSNAVVSGLFFGPPGTPPPPPPPGSASFVRFDTTTQGNWKGTYGSDGYNVINDTQSYPAYANVTPSGQRSYTWAASTGDVRALQKAASSTDRIASTWYTGTSYTYSVDITDGQTHALALYAVDWDSYHGRAETIEIRDAASNALLDSRDLASFVPGVWAIWNIGGSVTVVIRNANGASNAVVSGLFFGAPASLNLLADGGFEAGATATGAYAYGPTDQHPWVWSGGSGVTGANSAFTSGNSAPPEGRLAAFLQQNGAITQAFNAPFASDFFLSFRVVNRGNYGCQQSIAVSIDGSTVLAMPVPASPISTTWMFAATPSFTLAAGPHSVQLAGTTTTSDCTAFVDDVRLSVPPTFHPSTIAGSFEEWPIGLQNYHYDAGAQPWNFAVGSGLTANGSAFGAPNAPQGAQAAFVQATGYMEQAWADAGGTYQIQFSAAGRLAYGTPTLGLLVDGVSVGSWVLANGGYSAFSTAPIAIAPGPHVVRFTSSGSDSFVDDVQLVVASASAAGAFNAFESGTAAGAVTGVIHTKIAGASFALDVVVLDSARGTVQTSFSGAVKVELLNAADNTGPLDATTRCRSTWTTLPAGTATTLTFAAADAGRKSVTLGDGEAWRDLRVRISTPTTVACSSDDFALRPAAFASLAVTDADWQSAGSARSLANTAASGGNVHRAGQPFSLGAVAVNASGTTTANYNGTAVATTTACTGTACGGALGALVATASAVGGVIARSATYGEVGSFALQLADSSFASVDAGDGSSLGERTIASPTLPVGRFVPDHFDVTALAAPTLMTFGANTCAARSFTYVGQPFGYAAVAQASVVARNATGTTTANYAGSLWKLAASAVAQTFAATPAAPVLDASATTPPTLTSNNNGSGVAVAAAADRLRFTRPPNAPLPPFNAAISLTWAVQDGSEAGIAGNGTIATATPLVFSSIAFDAGNEFRFGVLRLVPAYGSELVDLPVPIEAQYWDGQRMATNAADQCTAVPMSTLAMGNYQRSLAACKTAVGSAAATLVNGRTFARLARPGSGNGGSVDLALQLGSTAAGQSCAAVGAAAASAGAANLPWLRGRWGGAAAFDQNPATRASFGQYRSPLIYQREMY